MHFGYLVDFPQLLQVDVVEDAVVFVGIGGRREHGHFEFPLDHQAITSEDAEVFHCVGGREKKCFTIEAHGFEELGDNFSLTIQYFFDTTEALFFGLCGP